MRPLDFDRLRQVGITVSSHGYGSDSYFVVTHPNGSMRNFSSEIEMRYYVSKLESKFHYRAFDGDDYNDMGDDLFPYKPSRPKEKTYEEALAEASPVVKEMMNVVLDFEEKKKLKSSNFLEALRLLKESLKAEIKTELKLELELEARHSNEKFLEGAMEI